MQFIGILTVAFGCVLLIIAGTEDENSKNSRIWLVSIGVTLVIISQGFSLAGLKNNIVDSIGSGEFEVIPEYTIVNGDTTDVDYIYREVE